LGEVESEEKDKMSINRGGTMLFVFCPFERKGNLWLGERRGSCGVKGTKIL